MKTLRQELKEAVIVHYYSKYGLYNGDHDSYDYFCQTPDNTLLRRVFYFWERKYIALGYVPLSSYDWMVAGGYGAPYEHLLRQKPRYE